MSQNRIEINPESPSISFNIEYQYPFPIADLYKRYRTSVNPVDKLGYMISTIEIALRFLSSFGITLYKSKKIKNDLTDIDMSAPTLGTWKILLQRLLPIIIEEIGHAEELNLFLVDVKQIITMRNKFAHSSTISEDVALLHIEENKYIYIQTLDRIRFLSNFLLIVPEKTEFTRNPNGFKTIIRICKGCNSHFQFDMWNIKSPLYPTLPYFISLETSKCYLLHPLIRILKNKNSGTNNFYFYSKKYPNEIYSWQTFEYFKDNLSTGDNELNLEMKTLFEKNAIDNTYDDFIKKIEFNYLPNFFSFSLNKENIIWFDLPTEYTLIGKIGEGKFSEVYKIKHNSLNEIRVLKIPKKNTILDYKIMTRFDTEAKILSKLKDSKTAIRLHEYGKNKTGIPYLIEELATIGTLEESLNRWGKLDWKHVVEIGADCFKKLQIIHKNGIIHRDLKLSNILVNSDNERLFCDFGVSKLFELERDITSEGDNIGTYIYMPPEQREGKSEIRSDFYSLGVCLIVLLAGEIPLNTRNWVYDNSKYLPKEFANLLLALIEPIIENRPNNINAILQILGILKKKATEANAELAKEENQISKISKPKKEIRIWFNSEKKEFRYIPKGEFIMGGTKYPDERPVHKVIFTNPFYIATTPVTNEQFMAFVNSTKYKGNSNNFLLHLRRENLFSNEWRNPDSPVVFVSWFDAKEYVLWRSEKDNKDYSLPTEAEWEYACRAGNRLVYPWGNSFDIAMMNVGNIIGSPTPVGTYPPNEWGLYDVLGNVWEWCEDYFDVRPEEESIFYKYCSENFPFGIDNPVNTGSQPIVSKKAKPEHRAGRGGSWFSESHNCRPANRRGEPQDKCLRSFGFRLIVKGIKDEETKVFIQD